MATSIIKHHYNTPEVNTYIISNSSASPPFNGLLGGDSTDIGWNAISTTIEKDFITNTYTDNTNNALFTPSSNVSSIDYLRITITGHSIMIRIRLTTSVALGDSDVQLGTFNITNIGYSDAGFATHDIIGFSDGGNGIAMCKLVDGVLTSIDVVTRTSTTTTIPSGSNIDFTFNQPLNLDQMSNSFCNRFYHIRETI